MKQKYGLLLFITSCIPGCGQMHQGYMKRGISLLTAFCAVFALAVFLEIGALAVLMIPLWLYSFFDSYNLRSQIAEGIAPADAYLFGLSDLDAERLATLCRRRHSILGWVLVILGVYVLFDTFVGRLLGTLTSYFPQLDWLYYMVMRDLPRLVVTVGIIALGVWFIRGPKNAQAGEIPAFTPPAGPAREERAEAGGGQDAPASDAPAGGDAESPEQEDGHGDE